MARFTRVDRILDFAIGREMDAHKFYTSLAKQARGESLREVLKELAEEELSHKARLEAVKEGQIELFREKGIDLELDDDCVQVGSGPLDSPEDIAAMGLQKEAESLQLYVTLAQALDWGGLRETFLLLAQEETRHKLRFEHELDGLPPTES